MRGAVVRLDDIENKIKELTDSDAELQQFSEEWNNEYEFRKKLVLARKAAGLTQKELGELSGLDYRAISRAESSADISPNLKTLIKYLNALGYQLDIVKFGLE